MRHQIDITAYGAFGPVMADAIEDCVHCGFCLPTCPTYRVLGHEMASPRGRIIIMKEALEGQLGLELASEHLDPCLGCLACVTACPSGVEYGELITAFRMTTEDQRQRPLMDRVVRTAVSSTLPHPRRFRVAARMGNLARRVERLLPERLRVMVDLLPDSLPARRDHRGVHAPIGEKRGRVALLLGCAQQVLAPDLNTATIKLLTANGIEVVVPDAQGCCGALAAHTGLLRDARTAARKNMDAFDIEVDAVITNAAGCGSGMHEYGLWLRGEPDEQRGSALADITLDVCAYLARIGLRPATSRKDTPRLLVAYHDACHLAHGQGIREEPRELLRSMPGVELVELPDAAICCGSAGTYNMEQPAIAARLGQDKADLIRQVEPDIVVTGNIGCMTQLSAHLEPGTPPVMHTVELLAGLYE